MGELTTLDEYVFGEVHKQSERFVPELDRMLQKQNLPIEKIHRFITTKGPGSFTGMRIAFSSIKAFSHVFGSAVELVEGSEAIALRWLTENPAQAAEQKIAVVTRIATEKYFVSYFHGINKISEELISMIPKIKDHQVLINEKVTGDFSESTLFPLRSTYLAESLLRNQSRKAFTKWAEISKLQPLYLGDTKFTSSADLTTRPLQTS